MKPRALLIALGLASALVSTGPSLRAEDQSSALSGLLKTLKDNVGELDVPANMSELPKQFSEMKANYVAQTETLESLQEEVAALRKDLEALRAEVALLKGEPLPESSSPKP